MISRRVIKIGGSWLTDPFLPTHVPQWLAQQPPAQNLIVIGGGEAIEAMRELAAIHSLNEPAMHWRCVRMLRATSEVLSELIPQWQAIWDAQHFQSFISAAPVAGSWLVAVDVFYHPAISRESGLPEGWDTTTDAIAAYLARLAGAEELFVIKSCEVQETDPVKLAEQGIVDPAFPQALPTGLQPRIISKSEIQATNPNSAPPYRLR